MTRDELRERIARVDATGRRVFPGRTLNAQTLIEATSPIPADLEPEDLAFVLSELRRLGWE